MYERTCACCSLRVNVSVHVVDPVGDALSVASYRQTIPKFGKEKIAIRNRDYLEIGNAMKYLAW